MKLREGAFVPGRYEGVFMYSFFDDLFDSMMRSTDLGFHEGFPASNVFTDEDGCTIELALAGYKKDQLHVEVDNNKITVSADTGEEDTSKKYHNHRIKRSSFKRVYTVPTTVYDLAGVKVKFEDGLLSIFIPSSTKKIEAKTIMIE